MKGIEVLVYAVRGVVASMPPDDRVRVEAILDRLRTMVKDDGDYAKSAIAVMYAELMSEPDTEEPAHAPQTAART